MLKVIISDDEQNICHLIESMIDWEEMGLTLVGITHNGVDTCQKIDQLQPDIVITDIKMPQMDGLEVIKHALQQPSAPKFIVISGFSNFQYAYTAIKYGVEDFLIKPLSSEELRSSLEKTILKIISSRAKLRSDKGYTFQMNEACKKVRRIFLASLFNRSTALDQRDIKEVNAEFYFSFEEGLFRPVQLVLDGDPIPEDKKQELAEKLKEELSILCFDVDSFVLDNQIFILLNYSRENARAIDALFNCYFSEQCRKLLQKGSSCTVCIGTVQTHFHQLEGCATQLEKMAASRAVLGVDRVIRPDDVVGLSTDERAVSVDLSDTQLQQAAELMDFETFETLLTHYIEEKTTVICSQYPGLLVIFLKQVYDAATQLIQQFHGAPEEIDSIRAIFDRDFRKLYKVEEMKRFVITSVGSFVKAIQRKRGSVAKKLVLVKEYVKTHYMDHIELEDVAKQVYLSPGYLGRLFKQEFGVCFSDYVIQVKMDAAKEMLRDVQYNISEIADILGYKEARYFSKFFKKYTGVKPSDYRKLYQIS